MNLSQFFCHCFNNHHYEEPPAPPASESECWEVLKSVHGEAQYRWSLGQGNTLEDQKNKTYDVLFALVRHHGKTVETIHEEIRKQKLYYLWLYPLPHPNDDPECATVCRDAFTRETRPCSVGVFLGPESEYILVRQATRGSSLSECGFLELK